MRSCSGHLGVFLRVLTEKNKNWKKACCVFLDYELKRSNPVLVFEVVVGFVSFSSHLVLNALNMREGLGK